MILITYGVDQAIYNNPNSIHNIVLTTTMYSFQAKKLVHLQYGKLFRNKVENKLRSDRKVGAKAPKEQFMLEDETGSIKSLTHNQFEKKLKQFDPTHTVKEKEVWESYCYTDKCNQQEVVQIAISIIGDSMTAVIDFESVAQYMNFVQPAWLILLDDDGTGLIKVGGSSYE